MFRTLANITWMRSRLRTNFYIQVNNLNSTCMRPFYTDRYMGLDTVLEVKLQELSKLKDKQNLWNLKSRIIASAENGLVLSSDLESISTMVSTDCGSDGSKSDLKLYNDILSKFISLNKQSKISLVHSVNHVNKFYQLCHLLDAPEMAMYLFNDENVRGSVPVNSKVASYSNLLLMNLLYKSEKYSDILRVFEEMDVAHFEKTNETNSILTLTLLALVKLNLSEAFSKATMFMETYLDVEDQSNFLAVGKGRLTYIYAWLACKDGEYQTAYEIVQAQAAHHRKQSIGANIKLLTLLKMDKIIDTIFVLEDIIDNDKGQGRLGRQKPKLCKEVIQLMVKAVKESQDKEVISRLKDVFSKLDFVAEIIDESIEDLLCVPVDTYGSVQRKRNTELSTLRKKYSSEQQAE